MANLELDKELAKKKMMAEVKLQMARDKRKLLEMRDTEGNANEESKARMQLLGSRSQIAGGISLFKKNSTD